MTGSIQEKKGFFYMVLNAKADDGKRKQKWIPTGLPVKNNKRKADSMLTNLLAEYNDANYVEPSKQLFCDLLVEWVESNKSNLQATTYTNYKYMLNAHVFPYFKKLGVTVHSLTPLQVQRYYDSKINDGLSSNTVLRHHALIRSTIAHAVKLRIVKENVADLVTKPKKKEYKGQPYSEAEIKQLISIIKGTSGL